MVVSIYSKEMLKFVYNLTKTDRVLNNFELSDFLENFGQKVSDRTIKRWFVFLEKHLAYFSRIKYTNLNLIPVSVLLKKPNYSIVKIVPYSFHFFCGFDSTNLTDYLLVDCLIPNGKRKDFKRFWDVAVDKRIVESYELFHFDSAIDFYAPLHKVVTSTGEFEFPMEVNISTTTVADKMKQAPELRMSNLVRHNPLIVPILIEYSRCRWSSYKVWDAVKDKLGEEGVWDYIRDIKYHKYRRDSKGIAFVQKTWKQINKNYNELFQGVVINYTPLYQKKHIVSYMFLRLKDKTLIPKLAEGISKNAVQTVVYLPFDSKDKRVRFFVSTNNEKQTHIIRNILPKYIDEAYDNKIIYMDFDKTDKYWSYDTYRKYLKLDYANLFDLKTCTWKFNIKDYLKKLDRISIQSR